MEIRIQDIPIYYEIHGEGRPLVTLHGFWPDHRSMKGCLEPLFGKRPGWRRIYFDLPGMGRTPGPEWLVNSDQMLQVALDFIEAVVPGERFALAGYSYGAYLARGTVCRMTARVDGLLMICPLIVPLRKERDLPEPQVLVRDEALLASLTAEQREAFEGWVVVQNRRVYERALAEFETGVALADMAFLTRLQEGGYPCSFDVDGESGRLEKPTLIVTGRQDATVGYRDAWKLLEQYPRGSFAVLDMAGHALPLEQEAAFNALAGEWLDRMEGA